MVQHVRHGYTQHQVKALLRAAAHHHAAASARRTHPHSASTAMLAATSAAAEAAASTATAPLLTPTPPAEAEDAVDPRIHRDQPRHGQIITRDQVRGMRRVVAGNEVAQIG